MKSLMNINSKKLLTTTFENAKIGDTVHTKGSRITGFGTTWTVARITPKMVILKFVNSWIPVFEDTAFGRIANGEDSDRVKWMQERDTLERGRMVKFWKDGNMVGFREISAVQVCEMMG